MKKITALIAAALLLMLTAGCGRYVSSYNAVGFVHSNTSGSAFMNFYSFEGRMVFSLKSSPDDEIKYTASLGEGNAAVYYDCSGTKTELFHIDGGGSVASSGGELEDGTVYIIVETDGRCINGGFSFSIEKKSD